uniref:DUF1985 domain-containing protein n=1 Tax=Brassica oleracea var. oleracea TaxID=109376 RepID=A0A0D2ZS94_BRAOL
MAILCNNRPKNRDFDDGDLVDEPVKSTEKSSLSASLPLRFSPLLSDSLWFSSPLRYSPPLCFSSLLSISLHLSDSLPVSASLIRLSDMELELPKRLYAEGSEPRVKKINNSCRMELIRDLKKAMCAEYDDVKRDHVFTHIMAIAENDLKFSGKLVDSFICRLLITSKLHEKWFVFARTPLRFSLQKYHAVTGLKITRETNSDVVKWKNDGVFGVTYCTQTRKKLGKKESYIFEGFSYALLIWIMEVIPDFAEILGRRVSDSFKGPRCGNWKGVAKVSYEDIIELEDSLTKKDNFFSVISVTGNGDVFLERISHTHEYFKATFRKKENHLFKWVDDALLDEIRRVEAEQGRIVEEIEDLKSSITQTIEEEVRKQKIHSN